VKPLIVTLFAPDCTDANVIKRARAFKDNGFDVFGLSYRRNRYNQDYVPEWENIHLGLIKDRQYLRRVLRMFRAGWRVFRERKQLQATTFYFARNADLAVLALLARWFTGKTVPIVYEVIDIPALIVQNNLKGKLARWLEQIILKRCDLLVTTSPGFIENYFLPIQNYTGKWFILEHRLYPPYVPPKKERPPRVVLGDKKKKWVIGYFGTLRCPKSWEIIKTLAQALPDKVEFYLRGRSKRIDPEDFNRNLEKLPNIRYEGEYRNPEELDELYGQVDIAWCFDFCDEQHNSRWLLPNRLYEGGYFKVPMLSAKGFEVGKYIEKLATGWTFDPPYTESLIAFLDNLTVEAYLEVKENYHNLPASAFVSKSDFQEMCEMMFKS
jgi:succinoglycan biosynthesis protein ExoL